MYLVFDRLIFNLKRKFLIIIGKILSIQTKLNKKKRKKKVTTTTKEH